MKKKAINQKKIKLMAMIYLNLTKNKKFISDSNKEKQIVHKICYLFTVQDCFIFNTENLVNFTNKVFIHTVRTNL